MDLPQQLLLLAFLFVALSIAAQITVTYATRLVTRLGIRTFAFGILLGLITTLPELTLGINAQIKDEGGLAVGNLLGGIIVIFSLILGFNILINRKVKTDGDSPAIWATVSVVGLPIVLGIDGLFDGLDALIMISSYVLLVYYLYTKSRNDTTAQQGALLKRDTSVALFLSLLGILGVMIFAHWIVEISETLFSSFSISPFMLGITVFAFGTNLPEISIALASWRKSSKELSLGHLVGSAFTNVLIIGLLALLKPIPIETDIAFWISALFLMLIALSFAHFYKSNKNLDHREGVVLILLYVAFVGAHALANL